MSKKKDDALSDIEKDIRRFLIPVLRRASLRFKVKVGKGYEYPRTQAKQASRIERGLYKCASCGEAFKEKDTVVDHTNPVVALEGDDYDWNTFINRLYVGADKLQILCIGCHDLKSLQEDNLRTAYRETKRFEEKRQKEIDKAAKKLAKLKKEE